MRVIVITDGRGDIESVAVLAAELADQLDVETEDRGIVHKLDVDHEAVSEKSLRGSLGDEARARAYKVLQEEIRRRAARSSDR